MWKMFEGAVAFQGDVSKWDISNVGSLSQMFNGAKAFNGDLSTWTPVKVTSSGSFHLNSGLVQAHVPAKLW